MITALIQLAEDMYAASQKTDEPVEHSTLEEQSIYLGHVIEEIGKEMYKVQEIFKAKNARIEELEKQLNELSKQETAGDS
jgi:predicted Rossmann fold nucleotide-binding protein DprA/Smf involved in DNA uptake